MSYTSSMHVRSKASVYFFLLCIRDVLDSILEHGKRYTDQTVRLTCSCGWQECETLPLYAPIRLQGYVTTTTTTTTTTGISSAGLSKRGAWLRSLWWAPKIYCAEQRKDWGLVRYKIIIIKSVRELCVVSHCVFLEIKNARIPHQRGARLRQIGPVGLKPALSINIIIIL
jgi:hypothetical protein